MKPILFLIPVFFITITENRCSNEKNTPYKGRLETKGICMNYTISLLEGNIDTSKIVSSWKDDVSGKNFTKVFALGSPCSFPSTINEGDEFYFTIDTSSVQNCAVCLAYYPKPPKSLRIKVVEK